MFDRTKIPIISLPHKGERPEVASLETAPRAWTNEGSKQEEDDK